MNYKVIKKNGEQLTVPENVGEIILKAEVDKINWGNIAIYLKDIKDVQPVEQKSSGYSKDKYLRSLSSMIRGCKKVDNTKAKALVEKMEEKCEKAKESSQESFNNPIKDISIT